MTLCVVMTREIDLPKFARRGMNEGAQKNRQEVTRVNRVSPCLDLERLDFEEGGNIRTNGEGLFCGIARSTGDPLLSLEQFNTVCPEGPLKAGSHIHGERGLA